MHKQKNSFNKDRAEAFKAGEKIHLCTFLEQVQARRHANTLTLPLIERLVRAFKPHGAKINFMQAS
jgi:hypothetical protein